MAGMSRFRRRRSRSRGDDRGAVAVEAALITPLIVLLLFGIIEFGFVFKNYLAVSSSTRAGVRIASAMPRTDGFAKEAASAAVREGEALKKSNIKRILIYDANKTSGLPSSGTLATCLTKCVSYTVSSTGVLSAPSGSWPYTQQNACMNDPLHTYVGVYVEYTNPGVTGLIFNSLTLSDRSVMSLEPMSAASQCK